MLNELTVPLHLALVFRFFPVFIAVAVMINSAEEGGYVFYFGLSVCLSVG